MLLVLLKGLLWMLVRPRTVWRRMVGTTRFPLTPGSPPPPSPEGMLEIELELAGDRFDRWTWIPTNVRIGRFVPVEFFGKGFYIERPFSSIEDYLACLQPSDEWIAPVTVHFVLVDAVTVYSDDDFILTGGPPDRDLGRSVARLRIGDRIVWMHKRGLLLIRDGQVTPLGRDAPTMPLAEFRRQEMERARLYQEQRDASIAAGGTGRIYGR